MNANGDRPYNDMQSTMRRGFADGRGNSFHFTEYHTEFGQGIRKHVGRHVSKKGKDKKLK